MNNKRTRYLPDAEEPLLFDVPTGPRGTLLRSLITVAIGTRMRRSDQLNLVWDRVDFQREVIYVPHAKMGKGIGSRSLRPAAPIQPAAPSARATGE